MGTANAPIFPDWNLYAFQLGKILCFKSLVWEVEKTGKFMRTSNAEKERNKAKGEAQISRLASIVAGDVRALEEDDLVRV